MRLEDIEGAIREAGLVSRGAFHPEPGDEVPALADGRPVATVVLAGNVGPAMWEAFSTARDPSVDGLDNWSEQVLSGGIANRPAAD